MKAEMTIHQWQPYRLALSAENTTKAEKLVQRGWL